MKECLNCERPYEVAESFLIEVDIDSGVAQQLEALPLDGFCSLACEDQFNVELEESKAKSIERGLLTIDGAPAIFEPQLPDTPISKQSTINSVISSLLKAKGD